MVDNVLTHSALHPCTKAIPDTLAMARSAKFPNKCKTAKSTSGGADASGLRPRCESGGQLGNIVHGLAALEVARCIV